MFQLMATEVVDGDRWWCHWQSRMIVIDEENNGKKWESNCIVIVIDEKNNGKKWELLYRYKATKGSLNNCIDANT